MKPRWTNTRYLWHFLVFLRKWSPLRQKSSQKVALNLLTKILLDFFANQTISILTRDPNDPLLNVFFRIVDQKYIENLILCCSTMHPDRDDPPFIPIVVYIWKGLSQLHKYRIVDFLGDKLIGMLRLTPVHFNTACEIFAGVTSGVKHWNNEETKLCESMFLKPFLLELFQHKITDSTSTIF